jgi:hypothetical protein
MTFGPRGVHHDAFPNTASMGLDLVPTIASAM